LKLAETEPLVRADRMYLAEILNNLLDNAVKFTAAGEVKIEVLPVTVSGGRSEQAALPPRLSVPDGEWLALRVIDTGIGIRPEDQTLIFESFRQADGSQTREYEGSGLGLTLSLRLVQMHHGFLWVESEPGMGSTFTILLPTVRPEPAAPAEPEPVSRPLVLVIDDGTADRQLINDYLGNAEYQIICTDDAEEGLVIAGEIQPDVVIADRAADGASILSRLETGTGTENIPVIVIVAADGVPENGALVKPLEADALRARVRRALGESPA
jgi:CheY-like chemotaxis protein